MPSPAGTFYRDALVVSFVLFFGSILVGFVIVMTVPRLLNLVHQTVQGLSPVRLLLRGSSVDRAFHQCQGLEQPRRRQLVDRVLPARHRVRPRKDRPDRVRTSAATSSTRARILSSVGTRNDGRRRAVDDERRVLEHVFPAVLDVHRGTQLPRQRHRLSAARQDARQLPARDEGHGADQREGPGECRAAGLPGLRDPAVGRARQQLRPPEAGGRAPPRPRRQEQAQLRHHLVVPVRAVVLRLPAHRAHGHRRGLLRLIGCGGDRVGIPARPARSASPTGSWSTGS